MSSKNIRFGSGLASKEPPPRMTGAAKLLSSTSREIEENWKKADGEMNIALAYTLYSWNCFSACERPLLWNDRPTARGGRQRGLKKSLPRFRYRIFFGGGSRSVRARVSGFAVEQRGRERNCVRLYKYRVLLRIVETRSKNTGLKMKKKDTMFFQRIFWCVRWL